MKYYNIDKKNKKTIALLAILSLMAFIGSANLTNPTEDLTDQNVSSTEKSNIKAAITVNPITIVNNWSAMKAAYSWIKGSGWYWDPYVIEDVIINNDKNKPAIYIEGSKDFFIIRNCTIQKSGTFNIDGIKLKSVENAVIENNTIKKFVNNIYILSSNNIKILNNKISNSSNNGTYIESSSYINVLNNSLFNNSGNALYFNNAPNNAVIGNSITSNSLDALKLRFSYNINIESNDILNNGCGVRLSFSDDNIIKNNHINNYGSTSTALILEYANYNSIFNNEFKNNYLYSISTLNSGYNIFENNAFDNDYTSFRIYTSSNNIISKNNITNSRPGGIGIEILFSSFNTILSNKVTNMSAEGIKLTDSNNNTIQKNYIFKCSSGIYLTYSSTGSNYNKITNNNVLNSSSNQLMLWKCRFAVVEYNLIANGSNVGIYCYRDGSPTNDNHTIRYNTIQNNTNYGVSLSGSYTRGNKIYLNNFISNKRGTSQGYDPSVYTDWYSTTMKLGNYWNNHTTPDKLNDGIIDNEYKLAGGSRYDNYPLKYPIMYYNLTILYVDKSFSKSINGWNVTRFNTTIGALNKLNNANYFREKSTIYVSSGRYTESLTISRSNVTIVGKDKKNVIFDGSKTMIPITINNQDVVIKNLTVTNSGVTAGIIINMVKNKVEECEIHSNTMGSGIVIYGNNNTVENCKVFNNTVSGIWIYGASNNIIKNCSIYNNTVHGIHIFTMASPVVQNTVKQNNFSSNGQYGVFLQGQPGAQIMNTLIELNKIFNNSIGIVLNHSSNNQIINNIIESNKLKGILINPNSNNNFITQNIIKWNGYLAVPQTGYGVEIKFPCNGNNIFLNDFVDNNNPIGPLFHACDINGGGNFWDSSMIGMAPIRGNYWNNWFGPDADGDGIIDTPPAPYPIQPIPPGTSRDNFPLVYPHIYYDISEIFVDDDFNNAVLGWQITRFNTIQGGINMAADGAIIHVNNGTYQEKIVIDKPCSIIGQLIGTIKPKIFRQANGHIISIGVKNKVAIQNFEIINSTDNGAGVSVESSQGVQLKNLNITNTINGISVIKSNNTIIENCTINSMVFQVYIEESNFITLTNNTMYGLLRTSNTAFITMKGNKIYSGGWLLVDSSLNQYRSHLVEPTNKVNDKSINYIINQVYNVIENRNDIGQLILVNVNNSVVYNNSIPNSVIPVFLIFSNTNDIGYNYFNNSMVAVGNEYSNYNQIIANRMENAAMAGVYLKNSNNNEMFGNLIQFGQGQGIYLDQISKNNVIYENKISNNSIGIFLDNQAQSNTIYRNLIANNSNYGVYCNGSSNKIWINDFYTNGFNQSYCGLTGNAWYYNNKGNYWSNYRTRYPTANQTAGIWDTLYKIDGPYNIYDNYPLVNPYPLGPTITILAPSNNSVTKTEPTITVKIIDANFTVNAKWFTINQGAQKNFFTDNASINSALDWNSFANESRIELKFYANNTYGFISSSAKLIINKDTKAPLVTVIYPVNNGNYSSALKIKVIVYEPHNGSTSKIWYECGGNIQFLTNNTENTMISTYWNNLLEGLSTMYFRANDTLGNLNNTVSINFKKDTKAPEVKVLAPIAGKYYSSVPSFNVKISDNTTGIHRKWFTVGADTTKKFFTDNASIGPLLNWNSFGNTTSITLFFRANDTAGNLNSSSSITIYKDNLKPSVFISTPANLTYHSSKPTFNVPVTDTYAGVHKKWFTYKSNPTKYYFTDSANLTATIQWSWFSSEDIINFYFSANDTAGNLNNSVNFLIYKDTIFPKIAIDLANNTLEWGDKPGVNLTATVYESFSPSVSRWYRIGNAGPSYPYSNNTEFELNQTEWVQENDGTVIIYVYAQDLAGNTNVTCWYVNKTTDLPSITVLDPGYDDIFNATFSNFTVQFSSKTGLSHIWIQNGTNGINITWTAGIATNGSINIVLANWYNYTPDGNVIFIFWANNSAGKVKKVIWQIVKDSTKPILTINNPLYDEFFADAPDFILNYVDVHRQTLWYKLNSTTATPYIITYSGNTVTDTIDSTEWNNLAQEGPVTIYFYANDTVGNYVSASIQVQKDKKYPELEIITPITNAIFSTVAPNFTIVITEPHLEYIWYKFSLLATKKFFITENGTLNQTEWDNRDPYDNEIWMYFYCNDSAGNLRISWVKIMKDTIAPSIFDISEPENGETYNKEITYIIDDIVDNHEIDEAWIVYKDGSGNNYFSGQKFFINNNPSSGTLPNFNSIPEGNFRVYFSCNDTAGNQLDISFIFLVKDTIVQFSTVSLTNNTYHRTPPSFNFGFIEHADLWYAMTGMSGNLTVGEGTSISGALDSGSFYGLDDGWFYVIFGYNDSVGNLNTIRFGFFKDTTIPTFLFAAGKDPRNQEFLDDEIPVFYIDIVEVDVSEIRYKLISLGIEWKVYPAFKISAAGLCTADMSNVAVPINSNHWRAVDYGVVAIQIIIFDQASQNYTYTFNIYKVAPSSGNGGDDTGTPTTTPLDMTTILIVIIGAAAAIGAVSVITIKRKKPAKKEAQVGQKLQIKAPTPAIGKMVDGKLVGEKAKKAKKAEAEEAKKELTPEEIEALKKTEKEMQVEKKEHTCIVHKGPIKGAMYLCPKCETFYCMTCARTLKANGEKCWSCESEIDVEVPVEFKQRFDANTAQGILESTTKYDATFKKAMMYESDFKEISQLNTIEFTLIDPEILKKIDKMELSIDKKKEILNDLRGLNPAEQQVLFESIFAVEEDEEKSEKK